MTTAKPITVTFAPSDNVPGAWVAECQELGLVDQGNGFVHTVESFAEGVRVIDGDDRANGYGSVLERRAATLTEAITWVPVGERLPGGDPVWEACRDVIVAYETGGTGIACVDDGRWANGDGTEVPGTVTHWAELPKGPVR